jgi:hypothetical protein
LTQTRGELGKANSAKSFAEKKLMDLEMNLNMEGCNKAMKIKSLSEKVSVLQKSNNDLSDQLDIISNRFTESEATRLCLSKVLDNLRSENALIKADANQKTNEVCLTIQSFPLLQIL